MRSHYCGELRATLVERIVTLCGWAHRAATTAGSSSLTCAIARDWRRWCDPDAREAFPPPSGCARVRAEGHGKVRRRPAGTVNAELPTGEVEVLASEVQILNPSAPPPFQLDEDKLAEETRLQYRVLDLRREAMQRNLRLRHRAAMAVRRFLDEHGFVDIETPVLYKSTPEGARSFSCAVAAA